MDEESAKVLAVEMRFGVAQIWATDVNQRPLFPLSQIGRTTFQGFAPEATMVYGAITDSGFYVKLQRPTWVQAADSLVLEYDLTVPSNF